MKTVFISLFFLTGVFSFSALGIIGEEEDALKPMSTAETVEGVGGLVGGGVGAIVGAGAVFFGGLELLDYWVAGADGGGKGSGEFGENYIIAIGLISGAGAAMGAGFMVGGKAGIAMGEKIAGACYKMFQKSKEPSPDSL